MKKYKCAKHKSNEGFYNNEGEWICWECIALDPYLSPRGRIIDSMIKEPFLLRLVDATKYGEFLRLEVFLNKKLTVLREFRDLSLATRKMYDLNSHSINQIIESEGENATRIRDRDYSWRGYISDTPEEGPEI